MWKAVLAGTAAAVISSSSLVFADQMCDRDGASRWQPSAADIKAFTDARVAALKAGLELTVEQEKNWPAVEAIGDGRGETRCYVPLRHCAFSHGAVLLKPFWTGPPHVVQLRWIVIEYFSEEGISHLQNLGPEPHRILATVKDRGEGHGVPALKLPVEIIKTQ